MKSFGSQHMPTETTKPRTPSSITAPVASTQGRLLALLSLGKDHPGVLPKLLAAIGTNELFLPVGTNNQPIVLQKGKSAAFLAYGSEDDLRLGVENLKLKVAKILTIGGDKLVATLDKLGQYDLWLSAGLEHSIYLRPQELPIPDRLPVYRERIFREGETLQFFAFKTISEKMQTDLPLLFFGYEAVQSVHIGLMLDQDRVPSNVFALFIKHTSEHFDSDKIEGLPLVLRYMSWNSAFTIFPYKEGDFIEKAVTGVLRDSCIFDRSKVQ